MTKDDKIKIYNLLKAASDNLCGYSSPDFAGETPEFEDDIEVRSEELGVFRKEILLKTKVLLASFLLVLPLFLILRFLISIRKSLSARGARFVLPGEMSFRGWALKNRLCL